MSAYEPPIQNLAIFDPSAFTANDEPLTITTGSKYFLRFPNAQNTENFNELTANTISSAGNLTLNPTGNVRIQKTLNMTGNEIHNTNLIHSQNNNDIVIEGKGTGDVVLKTNNIDRVNITDTGVVNVLSNPIENCSALRSTNNSSVTIEGRGTGDVVFQVSGAPRMRISSSPIVSVNMLSTPILGCSSLTSTNNQNITIEGSGTGDVILRTNNTNALSVLDSNNINVEFPINLTSDTASRRSVVTSVVNFTNSAASPYNATVRSQIFNTGNLLVVKNLNNGGSTTIEVTDSGGVNTIPLTATSTTCNFGRPINMTDATSSNRNITGSLIGLNENVGGYSSTLLGQIYQSGTTQFHQNLATNSAINFVVKDSGANNITPFQMTSTANNIPANVNLNMAGGSGIINQTGIAGSNTAINILKRSSVVINSNSASGSATAGLEVYDDGLGGGRGLFILPNSGSGSLGNTNQTNDCCLTSRANQNNNVLTLSNWNSNFRNGIRIGTTDISNSFVTIQCGQNSTSDWTELAMNYTRGTNTTTTTFNNVINFNPNGNLAPSRRQLTGLGTLNFTDISGNTTTGSMNTLMFMDSSANVAGMFYDCSLNSGSHNFIVNDNAGNKKTPVFFGSVLTSVLNTFSVRNESVTSNRFDISTDTSQNTNIRARSSTASTTASININCDSVSAGGAVTNTAVATIAPTFIQLARPLRLIYQTFPSGLNELGFSITGSANSNIPIGGVASSANIRNQHTQSLTTSGTYLIHWGIRFEMNSGTATFTGGGLQFGISTTATNSFDTNTQTFTSYINLTSLYPTLTTTTYYQPTSCIFRTTSSSTIIYFNYLAEYTGGTNILPGGQFTITRIG
jgi:hypothetical protein